MPFCFFFHLWTGNCPMFQEVQEVPMNPKPSAFSLQDLGNHFSPSVIFQQRFFLPKLAMKSASTILLGGKDQIQ